MVQNLSGKTLDDCTLLSPLGVGRGGTTVWKAARPDGSLAAVKIIEDGGDRAAFEVAIKNAAQLRHPQIATVERWGRTGAGRAYVVSEFVDGEFLENVLQRGPVPLHSAVDIGQGVLRALQYAHDEGILHEGVRPSNVAVRGRDIHGRLQVKLVDFGLDALPASIRERGAPDRLDARALRYTAPELFVTGKSTPESDLYAVGALLYHLVTGQPPFTGNVPAALKRAHLARQPPSLAEVVPPGPGWAVLDRVCLRLMAKQPAQRLSRAADVLRALETVLATAPAPAPVYEVDDLDVMEAHSAGTGPQMAAAARPSPMAGPTESHLPAFGEGVPTSAAHPANVSVRQTTVLPTPLTVVARPPEAPESVADRRAIMAACVVLVASVGTWLWSGPFQMPQNQVRTRSLNLGAGAETSQIKITPAPPKTEAPTPRKPITEDVIDSTPPALVVEKATPTPPPVPEVKTPQPPPIMPSTITTVPAGAAVSLLDGSSLGHTPWAGILPVGVERVRLSRDGFISASVPIKPGQQLRDLALRPVTPPSPSPSRSPSPRPRIEPETPASPVVKPRVEEAPSRVGSRPVMVTPKPRVPSSEGTGPTASPSAAKTAAKPVITPRIGVADIPDGLMPGARPNTPEGPASVFVQPPRAATHGASTAVGSTGGKKAKPAPKKQVEKPKPRIQLLAD